MAISELTRREIQDVTGTDWFGRLDQVAFLHRLYPLGNLPSKDPRFGTMADDITQHVVNNDDWDPVWVFADDRLPLAQDDAALVRFLAETLHPLVISTGFDLKARLAALNELLKPDGWELRRNGEMSGRPIFDGVLLESEKSEELEPIRTAAESLLPTSAGVDLAGIVFKDNGAWHFGGIRACMCTAASREFEVQLPSLLMFRKRVPITRWADILSSVENSADLGALFGVTEPLAIGEGSKWSLLFGGWREELGRSVAERVPMLRARRGNGRFLRTNVIYRRFLAALERTEFLNPIGASTALNIEVPQAAENHTLSILEIEFPARIAECQSKHIGPEFELDILIRSSPAIDATHVSCGAKLQSSPTAAPVALNVGQQTDEHGWRRVEGALRADEEPTVAILRLGYGELSVLLPERQIPRAKELTLAKSKDQPVQRSIVVVERLAPAVAVGPATLVPQPEDVDENISLAVAAWTIGKRIGKGSYGKVYRAVHELTQQHAVVKLIDTSEKNAAERFRREASCLGTLTHPAIPSILDAGFIKKEELAYIVQEHLSGSDLERLFEAGWRPSEAETLEILRQVTMPLAVAHELGIIHRDLKPSNLFLEDLPYRRIRVLDFGCAKLIGASRLTSSGATVGALPYQPPEAFGGKTVEAPADVWTLAVTAYELLAGTHPFLDEDVPKTVGRILSRTYEPLDANKYPALAPIIDACLQVNPDHRPANAEELRALLDGQTTVRTSNESGAPPPVKPDASSPAPSIDVGVVVEGSQQEPIAAASSSTPNTSEIAPAEDATNGGHPAPRRLNRDSVKEEERTEYQGELLVRPIGDCDINATELRSEFDALVRTGIGGRVLKIMMRTQPVREARGFRWTAQNRPYGNVISKWELDLFDDAQLAFRWAKFTTGDLLLFDSLELLDGVVIPLNLYERALVAAAASVGGTTPAKLACRIASLGSRELTLDDRAQVTTVSMYSGKSDPTWDATLQSAFPQPLNTISKRLVNRALQNFRVERDRFEDPSTPAPIISLSQGGFQRYLTSAGLIENPT